MQLAKKDIIGALSDLPNETTTEDAMYKIYVLDKIKKGQEDIKEGKLTTLEKLKEEMNTW